MPLTSGSHSCLTTDGRSAADNENVHVVTRDLTIDEIIETGAVSAEYQPIVELDTGLVVGYEALARGPRGSSLQSPDRLFGAAARRGVTTELDWACRAAALRGALESGLGRELKLFVNVEPSSLRTLAPPELRALLDLAASALSVVVEVTERSLVDDPASLVAALSQIRADGMGIAIDDVGAVPASLALLPFVEPDVIKLDMSLVQRHTDTEIARIAAAVHADAEHRGALVLAEGIETAEHLDRALVLGARLGQGWMFGRPQPFDGPLPYRQRRSDAGLSFAPSTAVVSTPWSLVQDWPQRRIAEKRLLMPMSHHVEKCASFGESSVLLSAFQDASHFTPDTVHRYERLAANRSMVGAIATGMSHRPAEHVRGGSLPPDHPLCGEWTVTVVGPHDAAALIARDLGDSGPDGCRRFEYVITHDRPTVIAAGRCLLQYIDAR